MAENIDDIVDEFENNDFVESASSSGFTGKKIGRFIAVALFLALGTFAVIYSMSRGRDSHVGHENDIGSGLADADDAALDKTDAAINSIKGKYSEVVTAGKNAADKFTKPAASQSKFPSTSFPKPSSSLAKSSSTPAVNGFAKAPTTPKAASYKSPLPPPVLRSKPPEPPARFAAAPGKPLITSQGGFGELKKAPTQPPASNRFAAPSALQQKAANTGSLIRKSGAEAKQLLGNLAQSPATVQNKATAAVNSANRSLGNLTNQAKNAFGNATKSAQGSANRGFSAPAVKAPDRFGQSGRFGQPLAKSEAQPAKSPFAALPKTTPFPPTNSSSSRNSSSLRNSSSTSQSSSRFPANLRATAAPQPKPTQRAIPTATVSTSNRLTPASTVARPPITARPTPRAAQSPSKSSFGSYSGSPPQRGPAARVAAVTRDVPGDRRFDSVQAPSLSIEKLSPKEIQVGEPADFQIVLRNVGRVAVDDVQVYDQIPEGTEFISATPAPSQKSNRQLNWDVGTLSPGVEKRISVKLKPTKPGEIGSVAQYTFAARSSMRTRVTQPVLEITHRTKPQVLIGGDVLFDVIVTNKGDGPAKDVLIQEDVPEQLNFREGYREIEYEVGTLLPNQSRNVRLALKAKKAGKCQNVIFVSGSGGLKSQHKLNLEVVAPSLKTKSSGPGVRFLGRKAKHTFSVSNLGTARATNVNLIARLPSGLRYVQSNNKGTYNRNLHAVVWELAELQNDVDASVEVMTEPIAIGNQPIKFEATADLNMRDTTDHRLVVEHLVDVFIDIDDVLDPIEIGSETSYRVQVVNQGTKVATNVKLQVDFPNGLKPTKVDGPLANQIRGQQVVFSPIESLKPGARLSFVVSGQGKAAGDHRVVLKMDTDGRSTTVSKEESTRVYSDR